MCQDFCLFSKATDVPPLQHPSGAQLHTVFFFSGEVGGLEPKQSSAFGRWELTGEECNFCKKSCCCKKSGLKPLAPEQHEANFLCKVHWDWEFCSDLPHLCRCVMQASKDNLHRLGQEFKQMEIFQSVLQIAMCRNIF